MQSEHRIFQPPDRLPFTHLELKGIALPGRIEYGTIV
jgi:hypothetical protein